MYIIIICICVLLFEVLAKSGSNAALSKNVRVTSWRGRAVTACSPSPPLPRTRASTCLLPLGNLTTPQAAQGAPRATATVTVSPRRPPRERLRRLLLRRSAAGQARLKRLPIRGAASTRCSRSTTRAASRRSPTRPAAPSLGTTALCRDMTASCPVTRETAARSRGTEIFSRALPNRALPLECSLIVMCH